MRGARARLENLERRAAAPAAAHAAAPPGRCGACAAREPELFLFLRGADAFPDADFSLWLPENPLDAGQQGYGLESFDDPRDGAPCGRCGWRPRVSQIVIYSAGADADPVAAFAPADDFGGR